jgi:hypothetical protein
MTLSTSVPLVNRYTMSYELIRLISIAEILEQDPDQKK